MKGEFAKVYFERKVYGEMLRWKNELAPGHALFLKGAWRVGKTVMEIDFLVRQGGKVCPVEVKSGGKKSLKSLTRFKDAFGKKVGTAYVLHSGELKQEGGHGFPAVLHGIAAVARDGAVFHCFDLRW